MANNRLYLYDPESHDAFLLASSDGNGWMVHAGPVTQSYAERLYHEHHLASRLKQWLADRDIGASCGDGGQPTVLRLCTEADLPAGALLQAEVDEHAP